MVSSMTLQSYRGFLMPELPEVETIRSQLEMHTLGKQIQGIAIYKEKIYRGGKDVIVEGNIVAIRRFGKLLVIDLQKKDSGLRQNDNVSLAIHLKMTGRLSLLSIGEKFLSHTHVVLHLGDKLLAFSDARQFGYVQVLRTNEVEKLCFIQKLGKEPLKDLTFSDFEALLKKSSRPIKNLLLDQQKIAGIGNIYACEALWIAGIRPQTISNRLQKKEVKKLFESIENVLREGIARGGASDNTYRNLMGGKGNYQDFFKVYGRTGKPCKRCGTKIERMTLAGRGTFYCSHCQK